MISIEQLQEIASKPLEELIVIETCNVGGVVLAAEGIDLATVERQLDDSDRFVLVGVERSFGFGPADHAWVGETLIVGYKIRAAPLSAFDGWWFDFEIDGDKVVDKGPLNIPTRIDPAVVVGCWGERQPTPLLRVQGLHAVKTFELRLEFYGYWVDVGELPNNRVSSVSLKPRLARPEAATKQLDGLSRQNRPYHE